MGEHRDKAGAEAVQAMVEEMAKFNHIYQHMIDSGDPLAAGAVGLMLKDKKLSPIYVEDIGKKCHEASNDPKISPLSESSSRKFIECLRVQIESGIPVDFRLAFFSALSPAIP